MSMYIFIVNPASGNGKSKKVWEKIKIVLDKKNIDYRSFMTKYAGHAEEISRQVANLHKGKITAIITIGGDGTLHEVINGLEHEPDIPVSCIPAGSGNDASRSLRLPKSPMKALQQLLRSTPKTKTYDIGEFHILEKRNKRGLFINGMGIGFDGEVARLTNESSYKLWLNRFGLGRLAYVISLLRLIFKYEPQNIRLVIDGKPEEIEKVWLVAISNIPYYGGGMKITPKAKPDDEKLDLCIVHGIHPIKLFLIFGTVFFGLHHKFKEVTMKQGRWIQLHCTEPMTMHADGEIKGQAPVSITIHHHKRKMRL